jgi:hypothetical protein
MAKDPFTRILVVCHCCHQHIHCLAMNVKVQRNVVYRRSWHTRQDIRRILGYKASPYSPPNDIDVARIYKDYFSNVPPGSSRLGG